MKIFRLDISYICLLMVVLHNKNEITFELDLKGITSNTEIRDAVFKFFNDIKEKVYKRALESQKKYFKIDDNFYLVRRNYIDSFYKSREVLDSHGLLEENEENQEIDVGELDDELIKHYENVFNWAWSSDEISVSHRNFSIKNFNESYDYLTSNIFSDAEGYCGKNLTICFIELKFTFTNFCNCDNVNDNNGCNCNALHYVNDELSGYFTQ